MKFYETSYEEYVNSVEKYNLHPEIAKISNSFPNGIHNIENLIIYGPSGVGKYSQVLNIIKKYSPSELKYDRKIIAQTEKQQYIYKISDIHYEIDMSLLGCNSKILWHEIFFQIVDIISVKKEKHGIILCKNFHLIHTELLEIFYSYMQQYNSQSILKIKFFIITEHISFIPTNILNSCQIVNIKRPNKEEYKNMICSQQQSPTNKINILNQIELEGILNLKETRYFSLINKTNEIPKDIFNIICDNIIQEISKKEKLSFTDFRDTLYDILTYNLDVTECLWYILRYFIENNYLSSQDITDILDKSYYFLKYYNNNYRPIYHLESIMFYIVNKIHKYNEL